MDDRKMTTSSEREPFDAELWPDEVAVLLSNPKIVAALDRDHAGDKDYIDE
jgi:hypothetical protein